MSEMRELQEEYAEPAEEEPPSHVIELDQEDVMVVLSDVHLGDVRGSDPDLAAFLCELPAVLSSCLGGREVSMDKVHLVLNGDIVDYQLEAEDIALAAGAAFLRGHVAPLVAQGMHVCYSIGNHEAGLHYLLEEMPGRVCVGREHPWSRSMRQYTAQEIRDQMQPYCRRPLSRFGRGYLHVTYRDQVDGRHPVLIFHGDELNHVVWIYRACILMRPVHWLARPLFWLLGRDAGRSPLEDSCEDIYQAFELWVASQDEETISAANGLFRSDPGALPRLAGSFCGSRVARRLLSRVLAYRGRRTGSDRLSRAWRGTGGGVASLILWCLGIIASGTGRWLRLGIFSPLGPRWSLGLSALVALAVSLGSYESIKVLFGPQGMLTAHFRVTSIGLAANALTQLGLLVGLPLIIVLGLLYLLLSHRYLRCSTPGDLRKNLGQVIRYLLPLHNTLAKHESLAAQARGDAPVKPAGYEWCLIGHFHEPRMEVSASARPRLVDVGSWRAPDPHDQSAPLHNTFATISSEGVQLWQYEMGGALLIAPPAPGAAPAGTPDDGPWWSAPPVPTPSSALR